MSKEIFLKEKGREKMKVGVDYVVDAIKSTMGAAGRNVFLWRQYGAPHNTNDGYTIAKEINLIDPVENMGAELVKEVAKKTVDEAGDGTSSASLLFQAIISQGMDKIKDPNVNVLNLKRGIEKAVKAIVAKLTLLSTKVDTDEKLIQIATISANNDKEMGEQIAKAVKQVGINGIVTVEESNGYESTVEFADGMDIDSGFASPYFMNVPEKSLCVLDEPLVLLYGKTISSWKDVLPLIEKVITANKSVLVVADDFKGDVLKGMVMNLKNGLRVCCVKSPSKEVMEDIAIVTGATFINDKLNINIDKVSIHHLGRAETVKVSALTTSIIDGQGKEENIKTRIAEIESQIENSVSDFDRGNLKNRLAKLSAGVAIIKVGGKTQTEIDEKKDRTDDAKCATLAAMEEGYVAGGGTTFLHCLDLFDGMQFDNDDEKAGAEIVRVAIQYPFAQILTNAGLKADEYLPKIAMQEYGFGVNVKTNKVENLLETGVIDPTKVLRVSLENAASTAAMFLITECVVAENI